MGDDERVTPTGTPPTPLVVPTGYKVPYRSFIKMPENAQPSSMTCWAAVTAALVRWREKSGVPIEQVMQRAGQYYLDKFHRNEGIGTEREKRGLVSSLQLNFHPSATYTLEAWVEMLKTHGPLWITSYSLVYGTLHHYKHARILYGINIGLTEDKNINDETTIFFFYDPLDDIHANAPDFDRAGEPNKGKDSWENYRVFKTKYEFAVGNDPDANATRMIIHNM